MRYVTRVEDRTFVIEIQDEAVIVDGQTHVVDLRHIEPLPLYSLLVDNLSHEIFIEEQGGRHGAMLRGKLYTAEVNEERAWEQSRSGATSSPAREQAQVAAPMPGLVLELLAEVGRPTQAGEVLVVLESMKMRIDLRSPQDGVVSAVHTAPHDHVAQGQVLVTVSPQH